MNYELWFEIYQFFVREARLLDERHFEEWLELFTDEAVYWMPGRNNPWRSGKIEASINRPDDLPVFEDSKETLVKRVQRLRTGVAWSEEPPSRTRHLVTNIELEPGGHEAELRVHSNFLVYRAQLESDKDIFVGSRQDLLIRTGGHWKIGRRTILMEDVVHDTKPLSIFF